MSRFSLLRARGGISPVELVTLADFDSSPRTRRYFRRMPGPCRILVLFSAHAEVFPTPKRPPRRDAALLRARGGISLDAEKTSGCVCSSPRTRRYFRHDPQAAMLLGLFSAHAEVFPSECPSCWLPTSLLRARGGISIGTPRELSAHPSSPRTRRYFPG